VVFGILGTRECDETLIRDLFQGNSPLTRDSVHRRYGDTHAIAAEFHERTFRHQLRRAFDKERYVQDAVA